MCATVSVASVQRPTRAPRRAAANAASHPACPAPITITSKVSFTCPLHCRETGQRRGLGRGELQSLADTEPREDVREQILRRTPPRNFLERPTGVLQIGQDEFLGVRSVVGLRRA